MYVNANCPLKSRCVIQIYTTASIISSPRTAVSFGEYSDLPDMTSFKTFVASLAGHVASEAARSQVEKRESRCE